MLNKLFSYPPIVVYDIGFTEDQKKFLLNHDNLVLIDWLSKKKYFPISISPISFFSRRLYGSRFSDYRRECLLAQKPYIFLHWNKINPSNGFIFLDGDAIIIEKFDLSSFYNKITFTIRKNNELDFNKRSCAVINSGVIFFCDSKANNIKLLNRWCTWMYKTNEKLVEQSALTRLLINQIGKKDYLYCNEHPTFFKGSDFSFNLQTCTDYNYYWLDNTDNFKRAKIIHFKKSRRNKTFLDAIIKKIDSNYTST